MRAKMVDWMIEVLHNYKTNENTFFLAVELLDAYLTSNCTKLVLPSDLHLLGCTCMFLASKIVDIRPLKLRTVYEKIAHEKLPLSEIKNQETEILRALKFNVNIPTVLDYSNLFCYELFMRLNNWSLKEDSLSCSLDCHVCGKINELNNRESMEGDKDRNNNKDSKEGEESNSSMVINKIINPVNHKYDKEFLHLFSSVLLYIEKLISHDYKLMCEFPSLLSAGSVIVCFKICEQITSCLYLTNSIIGHLEEICEASNYELIMASQNILKLSQEFEESYKGMDNLKNIHVNEITSFILTNKEQKD
eukprot:CAMPEP_0170538124 /NCGR_PEP_ID=MMETSP0209-20121228/103125_1 /TAXON_ID=665100 ORGANISM="Litonotus pictus, Strain P1" /NCGR_SAMPLE_ID=MMETSP0209 /ASSEMBLY_ACC=CAM_ASM_000301 /LENGTH=304 /DNA_ID=CAMNT_0010839757 /DNA_START=937 /DNA_END=1848 /DNA_ORIENTATION=+